MTTWVAEVERFMNEAEGWSEDTGLPVMRQCKTAVEDRLGSYVVPKLAISTDDGIVILDPVARFVVGVSGLVDLLELRSCDSVSVVRTAEGWLLHPHVLEETRLPWSEGTFVESARRLSANG